MKDIKVGVEKIAPSWSKNGLLSAASFVFEIIALNLRLCISFSVVCSSTICTKFNVQIGAGQASLSGAPLVKDKKKKPQV